MNKLFPILFGVAIGSAATYFAMDAKQSAATTPSGAEKIAAPKSASKFAGKSTSPSGDAPAADAPRQPGDHSHSARSQLARQSARKRHARSTRVSRPHDRHERGCKQDRQLFRFDG